MSNFFRGRFNANSDDKMDNVNGGITNEKLDNWYSMMQNKDYDGLKNDAELVSLMKKFGYEFVDGGIKNNGKIMSYNEAFAIINSNWSKIKMFARFL